MKTIISRWERRSLIRFILVIFFIICSACTPAKPKVTLTPTPEPTSTSIPTITPTSTPTVEPPSIPHGLRPENAASQTLQNGTWVVENAEGKVTATWNKESSEWLYYMENIVVQQVVAGYMQNAKWVYNEVLSKPLPPDNLSTHFINPDTNEPMGYGTWREGKLTVFQVLEEITRDQPITYVSIRVRGGVIVNGVPVVLISTQKSVDRESIIAFPISERNQLGAVGVSDTDLDNIEFAQDEIGGIPNEYFLHFLNIQKIGQQALILVGHDYPLKLQPYSEEYMQQTNKASIDIVNFLNGIESNPTFAFFQKTRQRSIYNRLIFPQEITGEVEIN